MNGQELKMSPAANFVAKKKSKNIQGASGVTETLLETR
jgi:hypothetical protein